jgi:hypothetical protein
MTSQFSPFKRKKSSIFLFFLVCLILIIPLETLSEEKDKKEKPKLSSLEKSILIPGWGQIAEKRYLEGIAFFTLEAVAITGVIVNAQKGNKHYHDYRDATTIPDAMKYRELTEKYDIRRNKFILAAGAVWALNLLDMYLIYKKKSKNLFIFFGADGNNSFSIKIIKLF